MKYMYIAFESSGSALVRSHIEYLESISENTVLSINMIQYRQGDGSYLIPTAIKEEFNKFYPDEVIIGTHGSHNNAEYCYYEDFDKKKTKRAAHASEVADIVKYLLPSGYNRMLSINLVMCYGARTPSELNHISDSSQVNWHNSFAFRLSMYLHNLGINSSLRGYLTAVSVIKGIVHGEAEGSIELREKISKITQEANTTYAMLDQKLIEFYSQLGDENDPELEMENMPSEIQNLYSLHSELIMKIILFKNLLDNATLPKQAEVKYENTDSFSVISLTSTNKILYNDVMITDENAIMEKSKITNTNGCSIF